MSSNNTITKKIEMKAPISKVFKALTDSKQFGEWFHAKFNEPFQEGKKIIGEHTYESMKGEELLLLIQKIQPETYFSYKWHPYSGDAKVDYEKETPTLVEFRLEKIETGTRLTVTESGFDKVPANRRDEAFRMHTGGWEEQMQNIQKYVS